jgi:hypothetical protein
MLAINFQLTLRLQGIRRADTTLSTIVGINFADKQWSLGGIVCSRTKATELLLLLLLLFINFLHRT